MTAVYKVRLIPDGRSFSVADGETVLAAALRQGIALRHGCLHGNCSTCKYHLDDGDVDFGIASPYSLPPRERDEGWALLCCATPLCDLEIRSSAVTDPRLRAAYVPEERCATVTGVDHLGGALWRLRVELDRPLRFHAGQYVQLGVPGHPGDWRAYSIASAPSQQPQAEFIIKCIEGGSFSGGIDRLAPGTELPLRGPYGVSYLREGDGPVLLVGGGSGIAPIMAILEDAADRDDPRSFLLVQGARIDAEAVLAGEIAALGQRLRDLTHIPAVEEPGGGWDGEVGRVTAVLQRCLPDASPYDAHLCGNPPMCDSVSLLLEAKGIGEANLFFDRFYAAV
jgi:propane monooxygenase reductase subunit